jgi:hypothetical protein
MVNGVISVLELNEKISYRINIINMEKNFDNAKEIIIELSGNKFTGRYIIKNRMVTVTSGFGQKSTQVGNSDPKSLARMLLTELIQKK